jgi:hypothetical protein
MRVVGQTWQPVARPASADVENDGDGAALVVRALRLAAGPGCWPLVERMFRDVCGPGGGPGDGTAACCLFRILLQGLALGARRPLRLGFMGAPELTHDERSLLQVVAAAQAGDAALLDATAIWLARPMAVASVARAAIGFAELLAARGVLVAPDPQA